MGNNYIIMKTFVALSCLLAVATASPYAYYASPYATYTYGAPVAYASPVSYAAPVAGLSGLTGLTGPLPANSKALIAAGAPKLAQAAAKLNDLSAQLPAVLANIDPATKGDIAKVNGIVNDISARAMAEIKPTASTKTYTPQGLKEMCDYISKIGGDILGGLDNPAIFQKYTADLQNAITALNGKAAEITV